MYGEFNPTSLSTFIFKAVLVVATGWVVEAIATAEASKAPHLWTAFAVGITYFLLEVFVYLSLLLGELRGLRRDVAQLGRQT